MGNVYAQEDQRVRPWSIQTDSRVSELKRGLVRPSETQRLETVSLEVGFKIEEGLVVSERRWGSSNSGESVKSCSNPSPSTHEVICTLPNSSLLFPARVPSFPKL